jgi:WD40 repeat protein
LRWFAVSGEVGGVKVSPDGKYMLVGGDTTAQLWDIGSGTLVRQFAGHTDFVTDIDLSPNAQRELTGSWDKTARLWDAATGQELRRFTGCSDGVTNVAFLPDSKTIVTECGDSTPGSGMPPRGRTPPLHRPHQLLDGPCYFPRR